MSVITRLGIKPSASKIEQSIDQKQTRDTFSFKWSKRNTYESPATKENAVRWLMERYCDNDPEKIDKWLADGRKIILDAGCGAGYSAIAFFGDYLKEHDYLGIDISDAVDIARIRFQEAGYPGEFLKRDLMDLDDIPDNSIDLIFSEGVLHHTDNTEKAMKYLAKKVRVGGRFLFYVYAKKAVIREFTDDYIRDKLQSLSDEEAWNALEPLTKLGIKIGELNIEIDVPEDIPYLGIPKGKINLQRFFYWNIIKSYYRSDYSLDEMNHINFDWFRPLNCSRHTPEEVIDWCHAADLEIENINIQQSGITIIGRKLRRDLA